ncbi:cobalamin biosynthesis protein CobD [Leptospira hartskeerlii]|uniref:Cobalamin biosynthesis protein CobD n=1 Tax=Leptospira hartskeerlii TaxID=2023177 RepID=A0A2M9XFF6_9LEPT|nr:adenosylcobinamide-phosphate synthase CbiB [Leptospira hartskeerlii]PJZ26410.1 cobalamin biosynthesis protein CobD [Leptospira hartskeerlii]PJZ34495.1 cobalamin biosynthesis protein CobD [Leptospira hartskeerlii]
MNSIWILPASLLIDLSLGDPQGFPHPVRLIGKFARYMEKLTRKYISSERFAGIITAISVYSISFIFPWAILEFSRYLHPFLEELASVFIIYTSIALKDLLDHSKDVHSALHENDLEKARRMVGRIVGRDTATLEEPEIVRADLESVGESLVDGITAPFFFAVLLGPSFAMLYRSINTLDSLFGYKNETYLKFGWASARMDDLANYIPARLTAPILCISSALLGFHPLRSFKILIRDGRKHPSPNSGLCEAALAGALKIQLGGINYYSGIPNEKPKLGDPDRKLDLNLILDANKIIFLTSILSSILFLSLGQLASWVLSIFKA